MTDVSGAKPIRLLRDYRPAPWRITDVDLTFDLDPATTQVTSRLIVERDASQPVSDLELDAEDLELIDIRVDGRLLGADEYRVTGDMLIVNGTWVPNEVTPSKIFYRNTGKGKFEVLVSIFGHTGKGRNDADTEWRPSPRRYPWWCVRPSGRPARSRRVSARPARR